MNIDGKDVRLREVMVKKLKGNVGAIAKYQSNNISVTVDSRKTEENNSGMSTEKSIDRISIQYDGQTKVINTTGSCAV
jgi:hypothetical protein